MVQLESNRWRAVLAADGFYGERERLRGARVRARAYIVSPHPELPDVELVDNPRIVLLSCDA